MINSENAGIINALVRQALVSAQEVMGENGLNAELHGIGLERFVGNFSINDTNPGIKTVELAKFNGIIETFYGRSGKGLLLLIWGARAMDFDERGRGGAQTDAIKAAN